MEMLEALGSKTVTRGLPGELSDLKSNTWVISFANESSVTFLHVSCGWLESLCLSFH